MGKVDPMAEMTFSESSYSYGGNNPNLRNGLKVLGNWSDEQIDEMAIMDKGPCHSQSRPSIKFIHEMMKFFLFTCFCLNIGVLFSQTIIHEYVNLFELEEEVLSPQNLKGLDVKSILRYEVEFSENGKIDTLNVSQFILDTAGRVIFVETDGNSRQQWQKIKAYISYSKDTVNRTIYATALQANRYFRKDVQLSMRSTKVGDQYSFREYSVRNMRDSTIVRMEKDSFVRVRPNESVNYNYLFDYANKVMLLNEITTQKYNPQGDVVHRETEYFTSRYIESFEFHAK